MPHLAAIYCVVFFISGGLFFAMGLDAINKVTVGPAVFIPSLLFFLGSAVFAALYVEDQPKEGKEYDQ